MSRRRPLYTCGAAILAIVHKIYTKAQGVYGPIGSATKRIATLLNSVFPAIYALQCQWLAVLSFADDQILFIEGTIESLFPPSTLFFNKIDKLVHGAESLPDKFDDAMNKFPVIIHQVPFLDWALAYLISWLNLLITTLTHWGSKNTWEKEIMIDINCNDSHNENVEKSSPIPDSSQDEIKTVGKVYFPVVIPANEQSEEMEMSCRIFDSSGDEAKVIEKEHCPTESPTCVQCDVIESSPRSESLEDEAKTVGMTVESDAVKFSYKEMLEKGTKENVGKKEDSTTEEVPTIAGDDEVGDLGEKAADGKNEGLALEDPILELFEASWHLR
ncbi:hypothetical protein RJ639_020875 [Escallonia herrerae]|uniref:Uncharacterized protein n=1 Tax=Escallonia herrerae TaxID=1293975 RepID=A0AA89AF34_9ASTE|nr:hypothetical protein RJ639_020875 [Escallonia herrerae]